MADISSFLKKILSAIYGEEVRGSIHDALAAMNTESSSAMEFASTAKDSAQTNASLLADSNYIYLVGADAGTRNVYDSYGVSADNVTTSGQMTFRCDTTPTVDLSVFIIRLEVGTDE